MWIARDKDGTLTLYVKKPVRVPPEEDNFIGRWCNYYCGNDIDYADTIELDSNMFPNLEWEDEPLEVVLMDKGDAEALEKI